MIRSHSRCARGIPWVKIAMGLGALAAVTAILPAPAFGQLGGAIDHDALQILKRMTDYLGEQQRFAMHTENSYEDVFENGQKLQFHFSSDVVVQRPNKLRAEQSDGIHRQIFLYDGETLSVHDGQQDFYAAVAAPDDIDGLLHFARDALDLVPPTGDMVFSNAFELLTAGITSGVVVGKTVIDGVSCDHLAFTTPVVDWQVWVADGDQPLPYKYVLTTRDDPAQPQFITMITNWNTAPEIEDGLFTFEPPATAMEIDFVRLDAGTTAP